MAERTLSDYAHARQRTEMYLGSREVHTQTVFMFDGEKPFLSEQSWVPSLYTAFREIVDNALDEIVAHGHGDTLRVYYDPKTMEVSVEDNGRGIPIHEIADVGKGPAASYMMSNPRSGRNFDERGNVAGVNGLGAAIVNFTAEWFIVDIWRDGKKFHQRWDEGQYAKNPIHKTNGPNITKGSARTGTRVKFKPSTKVWKVMELPYEFIQSRMWDIAVANPNVKIYFNDERLLVKNAGSDPVKVMFENPSLIMMEHGGITSKFYAVTELSEDEHIHSLVNNIPVFLGGPHIEEFRLQFYNTLIDKLDGIVKKALKIKNHDGNILSRADVNHGILIYNITTMPDPQFDSQSKTRLVSEVRADVRKGFMASDVAGFIRKNPRWVQSVIDRCQRRTQSAQNRALSNEQKKLSKTKVASLRDATGRDRSKCILFIAEGESAISGMMDVRDSKIHGGIGLRGKIMNVHDVAPRKVLQSEALTNIMNSLGLKIGEPANRMHLRYGKVYICTDEDEDGKNITALLINFLYTFWPELFEGEPYIYKFSTPLIILVKGKERKYVYTEDYENFDLSEWKGWQIIRAKGLARLATADWRHAIAHPSLIPMLNDGNLKDTLGLIFDKTRADDRKVWLS